MVHTCLALGVVWFLTVALCGCPCGAADPPMEPKKLAHWAGERIRCGVCSNIVRNAMVSKLHMTEDADEVTTEEFWSEVFEDPRVCSLASLAKLFRKAKLAIHPEPGPDGEHTAVLKSVEETPDYVEDNSNEKLFHWQSAALEIACRGAMRRKETVMGKAVSKMLKKAIKDDDDRQSFMDSEAEVVKVVNEVCMKSKACRSPPHPDSKKEL